MEVKIGVQNVTRELIVETTASGEDLQRALAEALSSNGTGLFVLPDDKGGKFLVPAAKIAYVEFSGNEQRRVGFR